MKERMVRAAIEDSLSLKASQEHDVPQCSKARSVMVTVLGGVLGMAMSVAVNSVLFEISVSRMFAIYFGLVFCLIGAVLLMRAASQPTPLKRMGVVLFASIVLAGGICSFMFRTDWLWSASGGKVVIYTIIGISTSFTVTFSWLDIVSFLHDFARMPETPSAPIFRVGLVESTEQVWLILSLSIITGVTYGLIFGLIQLEEMSSRNHSRENMMRALGRTELFSLPFGALLGMVFAALNEYLRHRNMIRSLKKELVDYKPLSQDIDDGI